MMSSTFEYLKNNGNDSQDYVVHKLIIESDELEVHDFYALFGHDISYYYVKV